MIRRRSPRTVTIWIACASLALGCAPRLVAPPGAMPPARGTAYLRALGARAALDAVEADLSAWPSREGRRLPGTHARLLLAGPDAARLRIESAFGAGLDCAARGDSLTAYLPARRQAVEIGHATDSIGVSPGGFARRILGAAWRPPAAAWENARMEGGVQRVAWREGGDSLSLDVDAAGYPVAATWRLASGTTLEVRYASWTALEGTRWPERIDVTARPAGVGLEVRVGRVRAVRGEVRGRIAVPVPQDAGRIAPAELREALREALEGRAER